MNQSPFLALILRWFFKNVILTLMDSELVRDKTNLYPFSIIKIKSFSHITAYNGLNDTPVGQITHANNSSEAGMEYNRKREAETVQARLLMASELPKLGNIAQQNSGLLSVND